jgi:predicted kinase
LKPTLFIFGGLPGTGKSTLASAIAEYYGAAYIRIDTIEQTIRNSGFSFDGPVGYQIGYALALDNLLLGQSVVADSVNPLKITREAWKDVGRKGKARFLEIEIVCSDTNEHRYRVESRSTNIDGLRLPTWQQVLDRHYQAWLSGHLVLDTAGRNFESSISELIRMIDSAEDIKNGN